MGYAWARATRWYEHINQGRAFPFEFERPHTLSINLNRRINERLMLSASWVFQSGLPFTPVMGRQLIPSLTGLSDEPYYYEAFIYGERNSGRMRYYHRLDAALHYSTYTRNGNRAQWTFAVYNLYNRRNPYSYLFTHDTSQETALVPNPIWNDLEPFTLYQVSYFPIIPTVSYRVFFDDYRQYRVEKRKRSEAENEKRRGRRRWLYH